MIKKIFFAIGKIKEGRRILKKYAPYLDNGTYISNKTFEVFSLSKMAKDGLKESNYIFSKKNNKRNGGGFFSFFLKTFKIKIKTKNKKFYGQILLRSASRNETRIIDKQSGKMLTIFKNKERFDSILKKRLDFAKYYKTTDIFSIDYDNNMLIEQYIEKSQYDYLDGLSNIIEQVKSACFKIKEDGNLLKISKATIDLFVPRIIDFCDLYGLCNDIKRSLLDFVQKERYLGIITHGDLSYYNLIFNGEKFYCIDFESVTKRVFFFDIFYYVFHRFLYSGDKKYVLDFSKDVIKCNIKDLFNFFNLESSEKDLIIYFIFMLFQLSFWKGFNKKDEEVATALQTLSEIQNIF